MPRGYYDYVKRMHTPVKDLELAEKIGKCQGKCGKTYGYRRVHIWLKTGSSSNYVQSSKYGIKSKVMNSVKDGNRLARHICIIAERAVHVKGGCRGSSSFHPLQWL